jgi:hypothetical protein
MNAVASSPIKSRRIHFLSTVFSYNRLYLVIKYSNRFSSKLQTVYHNAGKGRNIFISCELQSLRGSLLIENGIMSLFLIECRPGRSRSNLTARKEPAHEKETSPDRLGHDLPFDPPFP